MAYVARNVVRMSQLAVMEGNVACTVKGNGSIPAEREEIRRRNK